MPQSAVFEPDQIEGANEEAELIIQDNFGDFFLDAFAGGFDARVIDPVPALPEPAGVESSSPSPSTSASATSSDSGISSSQQSVILDHNEIRHDLIVRVREQVNINQEKAAKRDRE